MMSDLFSQNSELERLPIQDAEIYFVPHFDLGMSHESVFQKLIAEISWKSEKIEVCGKTYDQPRLSAWFGDPGTDYMYSGLRLNPQPWTPLLQHLKSKVENVVGVTFNSVLANLYRDNKDSVGLHSDDEEELGPQPVIASLSLGAMRTFKLKHRTSKVIKPVSINLEPGSLLLMKGDTQKNWKHGIDKQAAMCGPRVNLTFRNVDLGSRK